MKLLTKLFTKSGKIALSAMQAIGLTAVVGVAGVAAYQFLSTPEDNTPFIPASYNNPGEVVYVSHANTGSYQRGNYTTDKVTGETSVQVSANTLKYLDRAEQREQMAQALEAQAAQSDAAASPGQAYAFGGTEGLGVGTNTAREELLQNNPMAQMQQSMSGIKDMVASAQQQAQAQASGKEGAKGAAAAQGGALGAASHDWSGKFGSGSGSGAGSTFALQDSGKNAKGGSGAAGGSSDAQQSLEFLKAQAGGMLEGTRIKGKASFGRTDNLGSDKDASAGRGRYARNGGADLEWIRKRSADTAANKDRATNEGGRAFLGSEQVSGGLVLADVAREGESMSSSDLNKGHADRMANVNRAITDTGNTIDQRTLDKQTLIQMMILSTLAAIALFFVISLWKTNYVCLALAIVATALIAIMAVGLIKNILAFADKWGNEGITYVGWAVTFGLVSTAVMAWLSALWASKTAAGWLFEKLGFTVTGKVGGTMGVLGGLAGAGGAAANWKIAKDSDLAAQGPFKGWKKK